jgi:hypothetical protein
VPVEAQPGSAAQQRHRRASLDEDELLLFAVRLEELTLTDSLTAYGDPADPFLPIGEFSRLLDLDIDVSPPTSGSAGRIGEAARPLLIDVKTGTARLGGAELNLMRISPRQVGHFHPRIGFAAHLADQAGGGREALTIAIVPLEAAADPGEDGADRPAAIAGR